MKVSRVGSGYNYNHKISHKTDFYKTNPMTADSFIKSMPANPSFGDGWKVNKKNFKVFNTSEAQLKYLGEVFRTANETEINEACRQKYQGFFNDYSHQARYELISYIDKAKNKMTELDSDISVIQKRLKTGDIGLNSAREKLNNDFISKINREQSGFSAGKMPKGILIINDGEEKNSKNLAKWLVENSSVNYDKIAAGYNDDYFISELKSKLEHNKKMYEYTGMRSLLEVSDMYSIFSTESIFSHEKGRNSYFELTKNAADEYKTTILFQAPAYYKKLDSKQHSKDNFDTVIHLKDGERDDDRLKLQELESEKSRMENNSKKLKNYVWYEYDYYDDSDDDDKDPRDDWRDRM